MTNTFHAQAACALTPGVTVFKSSVTFSVVFRGCRECGLILYHLPDLEKTVLPFTDEFRFGSLYSVTLKDFYAKEWCYLYYRDDHTFADPSARGMIDIVTKEGPVRACRFFYGAEDALTEYGEKKNLAWQDRIIYCLHAKGFTADPSSEADHAGTFAGLMGKIPYLKELGVTSVELLPIYEICPPARQLSPADRMAERYPSDSRSRGRISRVEEALAAYPTNEFGMPVMKNPDAKNVNYWGYGKGYYFAPSRSLAATKDAQKEFACLVKALHDAGLEVFLQLYFDSSVPVQTQIDAARFYVTHYRVDGFHLKGIVPSIASFAADPVLSDTALIYYGFPYDDILRPDPENPDNGISSVSNLAEYRDGFQNLARRFVKSDDYTLRDMTGAFLHVEEGSGRIRYVASYEGFTLRDLVSYNEKHNEDNGEGNRDGTDENLSWNCGHEGPTTRLDVRLLRQQQIKNFLTLLFLAQGTPFLSEGDEFSNSRGGNNNPYNQDNPTGWVNWNRDPDSLEILDFTKKIIRYRKDHKVFRMDRPFRMQDNKGFGFPDLSFHGKEAWMPSFQNFDHSVGILFCENYAEESEDLHLQYLAVNTYWEKVSLGLPRLPRGYKWNLVMDTASPASFMDYRALLKDQKSVTLEPRSIRILDIVWVGIPGQTYKTLPPSCLTLPWAGKQLYRRGETSVKERAARLSPRMKNRIYRYNVAKNNPYR